MKSERLHELVDLVNAANYQFAVRETGNCVTLEIGQDRVVMYVYKNIGKRTQEQSIYRDDALFHDDHDDRDLLKAESHIRRLMGDI